MCTQVEITMSKLEKEMVNTTAAGLGQKADPKLYRRKNGLDKSTLIFYYAYRLIV